MIELGVIETMCFELCLKARIEGGWKGDIFPRGQ